jgi:hypothetical protein
MKPLTADLTAMAAYMWAAVYLGIASFCSMNDRHNDFQTTDSTLSVYDTGAHEISAATYASRGQQSRGVEGQFGSDTTQQDSGAHPG